MWLSYRTSSTSLQWFGLFRKVSSLHWYHWEWRFHLTPLLSNSAYAGGSWVSNRMFIQVGFWWVWTHFLSIDFLSPFYSNIALSESRGYILALIYATTFIPLLFMIVLSQNQCALPSMLGCALLRGSRMFLSARLIGSFEYSTHRVWRFDQSL